MVVASPPKSIIAEWRFVVADGKIVTGSQYIDHNQRVARIADDSSARAFAKTILETGYEPDPVWVLDVCKTDDDQYHLLEIGGFSFAGLYACDKDAVVQAVSAVAERIHSAKHARNRPIGIAAQIASGRPNTAKHAGPPESSTLCDSKRRTGD